MNVKSRIILFGATGFTGNLIGSRLDELNIKFSAVFRSSRHQNLPQWKNCKWVESDFSDISIENQIRESQIVIACIGPYSKIESAWKILEFSARLGKFYIDLTGEQEFVEHSFRVLSDVAKNSGARIYHSCAFESFIVDLLALTYLSPEKEYEEIASIYHYLGAKASPGTRLTMQIAAQLKTWIYEDKNWHEKKSHQAVFQKNDIRASFAPYPEVLFFPRNFNVLNSGSYFVVDDIDARFLRATSQSKITDQAPLSWDELLDRHKLKAPAGPTLEQRKANPVEATLYYREKNTSPAHIVKLAGVDPYGISAEAVVLTIENLLKNNLSDRIGVLSPASWVESPQNILSDFCRRSRMNLNEVEVNAE